MRTSITREAIALASKVAFAKGFKQAGFRRQSNHFNRKSADLFHSVHFQASQWGTAVEGQFTVNLGVTSEPLYRIWTSTPLPVNPASAFYPITERIGALMPGGLDHWWPVDMSTDLAALADEVADTLLQYALPFFADFPDGRDLLDRLRAGKPLPISPYSLRFVQAILAKEYGFDDEAREQMNLELTEARTPRHRETAETISQRLGLVILDKNVRSDQCCFKPYLMDSER